LSDRSFGCSFEKSDRISDCSIALLKRATERAIALLKRAITSDERLPNPANSALSECSRSSYVCLTTIQPLSKSRLSFAGCTLGHNWKLFLLQ